MGLFDIISGAKENYNKRSQAREYIQRAKERCLLQVDNAFQNRVPAIISSHRLNYMGGIDPANRERNLVALEQLLKEILEKYPDVVFMSSDALGRKIIANCHE